MALRSAAQRLISIPGTPDAPNAFGVAWSAFLTLLVAGPWLSSGYIFGTDWPGPRHFTMPTELASSAPFQVVLAIISKVIGAEITGKFVVIAILFGAAYLAYHAAPTENLIARLGA